MVGHTEPQKVWKQELWAEIRHWEAFCAGNVHVYKARVRFIQQQDTGLVDPVHLYIVQGSSGITICFIENIVADTHGLVPWRLEKDFTLGFYFKNS
eukprot:XP_001709542.1 Hypothetical protein GL50803_32108 [Giardia lamblia ATCC 50803]